MLVPLRTGVGLRRNKESNKGMHQLKVDVNMLSSVKNGLASILWLTILLWRRTNALNFSKRLANSHHIFFIYLQLMCASPTRAVMAVCVKWFLIVTVALINGHSAVSAQSCIAGAAVNVRFCIFATSRFFPLNKKCRNIGLCTDPGLIWGNKVTASAVVELAMPNQW